MSDRLSEVTRTVSALRPTLRPDAAWADAEVNRIMSTPPGRARRGWQVAGASVAAVVAVGGTAYAGGLVPSAVIQRLGQGDQTDPIHRIGEVREVFDLTTKDGTRVQFFAAPNEAGGQCWTVTHDLAPDADPENLGFTCVSGPAPGFNPSADNGVGILPTDAEHTGAPILFGLSQGQFKLPAGTDQVRVTAPGLDRTLTIHKAEGWAVELPSSTQLTTYVVEFLDADGKVLDRVRTSVDAG